MEPQTSPRSITSNTEEKHYFFWQFLLLKCNGKVHPITGKQGPRGGVKVYPYSFPTSVLGGGGFSAPRPGRFTPGKDPVFIVQEAGWAPGPDWTVQKISSPPGFEKKVAGSIPDGVIGIFYWHNASGRTMAMGSTQHLIETSTRNISLG
jgi:hypothetical protein